MRLSLSYAHLKQRCEATVATNPWQPIGWPLSQIIRVLAPNVTAMSVIGVSVIPAQR
jgi:hypothetical protein